VKSNKQLAQEVWRQLSGEERHAFRAGKSANPHVGARTYIIINVYGPRFAVSHGRKPLTAWSELVNLSDAWARGEEDDGVNGLVSA
jgi:hypothetical protein